MQPVLHNYRTANMPLVQLTFELGRAHFGPRASALLAVSLSIALLSAFGIWRIGQREDRAATFERLLGNSFRASQLIEKLRPRWYHEFGTMVALTRIIGRRQQEKLLKALIAAGINQPHGLVTMISSKICAGAGFLILSGVIINYTKFAVGKTTFEAVVLAIAFAGGWRLPNLALSFVARRRRRGLERGMPDALDLLVICAEAGLSLDQAIEQVSHDLLASNRDVALEFAATAAEMRVLADRDQALENLVRRAGLASLRSVLATLSQSIKFGTPLAASLRVLATEMRTERLAQLETRAARLPVLLSIPLMALILPSLMIVICTPLVLHIIDMMGRMMAKAP